MNIFSLQSRGTLCLKAAHRTKSVRTVQNASKGCLFSQKDNLPICSGCILLIYRLFWPHKIFWRKISGERKKKGKPIHDNVILHAFLSIRRSDAADISNVLFWAFRGLFLDSSPCRRRGFKKMHGHYPKGCGIHSMGKFAEFLPTQVSFGYIFRKKARYILQV